MLEINVYHLNNRKYVTIVPDRVHGKEILLGKSCFFLIKEQFYVHIESFM